MEHNKDQNILQSPIINSDSQHKQKKWRGSDVEKEKIGTMEKKEWWKGWHNILWYCNFSKSTIY